MRRMVLLLLGLLALSTLTPAAAQSPLVVINVHAWDCPPCIQWHNTYKKDWMSSREFKQVRYVEIDSPTIRQAYDPKYWPEDLKPILKKTSGRGVPRYLIVKDGKILSNQFGIGRWPNILADLGKLLPSAASDAQSPSITTVTAQGSVEGK